MDITFYIKLEVVLWVLILVAFSLLMLAIYYYPLDACDACGFNVDKFFDSYSLKCLKGSLLDQLP
jgi:hypothetical protein